MTLAEFNNSVNADPQPPAGLSAALQALWWDAKGDWDRAHAVAQDDAGLEGSWVHAYLHRVEGDESNAGYWYRKARRPVGHGPFPAERDRMVASLLSA